MCGQYGALLKNTPHGVGGEAMELTSQIMIFIMTMVTGVVLGLLFDGYRVLRGVFNPRKGMTWFTDLLYWLIATGVVFISLVLSNWGELRFYVVIGIVSGLALYYRWLSLWMISLFSGGIKLIMIGLGFIKKILILIIWMPMKYCIRIVSWPFLFCWHKVVLGWRSLWARFSDEEKK